MKIVLLIMAILIVGGVAYTVVSLYGTPDEISTIETDNSLLTNDEAAILEPSDQAEETSELLAGGSSYADPDGVFVFLYPNEYQLENTEGRKEVRIFKTGATQQGQTEMYDGVIIAFETIDLEGKTLSEWVDDNIMASTEGGMMEVESPKASTSVAGYNGFTYTLRGLGTSEYKVVQNNPDSEYAVSIVQAVYDPENVGFQTEVNAILATLEIVK